MTIAGVHAQDPADLLAGHEPGEVVRRLRGREDWPSVLASLAETTEKLMMKDLSQALARAEVLVRVCDLGGRFAGRARRTLGQALAYANRFAEAEAALGEGARLAGGEGDGIEQAQCRLMLLHVLARQGRFDDAVRVGETSREAFVRAGEHFHAARADINIGVTLRMMDRPEAALKRFDRALPHVSTLPMLSAQLQSNRAEALLDLHRFAEAFGAFGAARTGFEQAGAARAAAIVEGNIADLFGRQGRLDEALEHFEIARRKLGEAAAPGDAARLEVERADAMLQLGLAGEAGEHFRQAIAELAPRGMLFEAARARAGLGRSLLLASRPGPAAAELSAAIAEYEALGHATGATQAGLLLARALLGDGRTEDALGLLGTLAAKPDVRPVERVELDGLLGAAMARSGAPGEARRLITSAIERASGIGLPVILAELHQNLAWVCELDGDADAAIEALERAMLAVEMVRSGLRAERHRATFSGAFLSIYDEHVRLWLDRGGDPLFALQTVERARARALLDVLGAGPAFSDLAVDPSDDAQLLRRRDELNGRIAAVHAGRHAEAGVSADTPEQLEKAITDVESRLAATRRFAGDFAPPPTAGQIIRAVPTGSVLVEYFWGRGEVGAFVVRDGAVRVIRGLCTVDDVDAAVGALRLQVSIAATRGFASLPAAAAGRAAAPLSRLGGLLMEPLRGWLEGAAQVGVVADGSLACVPFHALTVGGESMLDRADTIAAPSAAVLLRLASRPRGTGERVVIGVADERAPRAEDEARAVAAAMGACRMLTGPEATVATVKAALRGAGGVHIAAHARFVPHSPMQSAIRLSDGWLTARDLYGIELDGGLVVLSACDSGRTAVTHGREVLGLVRAFMSAGAGALVLSHWLLHDETAAATFADMYDSGVQCPESTADPAAALRRAQRCCRERLPHVAAWGPLYMVGGWNRGAT